MDEAKQGAQEVLSDGDGVKSQRSVEEFAQDIKAIEVYDSRNDKKDEIYHLTEESLWSQKISILAGQKFDNIGIGKATAVKAVARAFKKKVPAVENDIDEYGSVTETVREYDTSDLTPTSDRLDELYKDIEDLGDLSGSRQLDRFVELIRNYTVPWVVTYSVLGDLKIGVTHNTICMAAAEPRGYTKDEIRRGRALMPQTTNFVNAVKNDQVIGQPSTGVPFAPMKAKSKDPSDTEDWLAQVKLDGYRSIIHVDHGEVEAYSANMKSQTGVLPELDEINWPAGEWIFDAEVMAEDGEYVSTKERLQRNPGSNLPHTMNFWVFDVIVADGEDVSRKPFEDRIDIVFEKLPADERVVPVHAFDDIAQARSEAQRHGYEGLILKKNDHEVEFGQRSSDWLKDKITEETVDLRVAGFQKGTGKNAGVLGAIELETEDGEPMGNVGTGFTDQQREDIWNNRDDWDGAIVEISFDAEAGYEGGLRFPAFEERRTDKLEANSLQRLRNIIENN